MSTPAAGTPQLATTGATEQVRQLAQCGGTMYAVGTFTSIQRYSTTYARNNAFYKAWDNVSKDRDTFLKWIEEHVMGTVDFEGFKKSIEGAVAHV